MPEAIDSFGRALGERWSRNGYRASSFAAFAVDSLRDIDDATFGLDATVESLMSGRIPPPSYPDVQFSDCRITTFRDPRFYVQTLVWMTGSVAIHDHTFAGAFRVQAGTALHATYRFTRGEEVSSRAEVGTLELVGVEHLRPGDVRAIEPGWEFIHCLFHLGSPSVTMLARLTNVPSATPAHAYLRHPKHVHAIALAGDRPSLLGKQLELLNLLASVDERAFRRQLHAFAEYGQFDEVIELVLANINRLSTPETFVPLYQVLERRFGTVAKILPKLFDEHRRIIRLRQARARIVDTDGRFLLALSMLAPGAEQAVRLAGEYWKTEAPVRGIIDAARRSFGMEREDPLCELDEVALDVLECMFRAPDRAAAVDNVQVEADTAELHELVNALEWSDLFVPFFTHWGARL